MNKAFEKILERLEELQNNLLSQTEGDINLQVGVINGVMYSKKIVQEVGEEYKDKSNIIDGLKIFLQEKFNYYAEQAEMNLESECNSEIASYFRDRKELYLDRANIYGEVMRKIDMLAVEYNNGWIPCSERLPEDDSICIVTVEYPNNETVVDYGWFDRKGVCWFVGTQEFRTFNILAWQPLPKPFKEGD